MAKLPGSMQVDRAFRTVSREIKGALKLINQQAGKLLVRGDYTGAESLVERARQVGEFRTEVEALRAKWKELRGGSGGAGQTNQKTPLWEYYQPILRALVAKGGRAAASELEEDVEAAMAEGFKPGDADMLAGNRPRWKVMIKRARRHMAKEGLIEDKTGVEWRITAQGQKAAARTKPTGQR